MESKTLLHLRSAEFDSEILQSEVPAVVDFYADWCGPCTVVSPVIESLSREYDGKVKFAKVDTDANHDLSERYGVMSIPTVFIFKGGQIKERIVGAAPEASDRLQFDEHPIGFTADAHHKVVLLVDGSPSTYYENLPLNDLDYCSRASTGPPCFPTTMGDPLYRAAPYPYGTGHTIIIEYVSVGQ